MAGCYKEKDDMFLTDAQLSSSCTSRIISGTFRNPLISSESENEEHDIEAMIRAEHQKHKPNKNNIIIRKDFIPGLRPLPSFPKLSALTRKQHFSGVKVLAEKDPTTNNYVFPPPNKQDYVVFEELQEAYLKEQQEFLDWAKKEWVNTQCVRALRPKPIVEQVYEAEWSVKAAALASLPTNYEYFTQINMTPNEEECQLTYVEDLKTVDLAQLPVMSLPPLSKVQALSDMPEEHMPRACPRHPCRTVLPDENKLCALNMMDIQSELAIFAAAHQAQFIISEHALKCLLQVDMEWTLPVTAQQVSSGGKMKTVIVIDGKVSPRRLMTRHRTAQALHHLLRYTLTSAKQEQPTEGLTASSEPSVEDVECEKGPDSATNTRLEVDQDTSDEEDGLCIVMGDDETDKENGQIDELEREATVDSQESTSNKSPVPERSPSKSDAEPTKKASATRSDILDIFNKCICQGTPFEKPPHVSYTKWKLGNKSGENISLIIHCTHKHVKDSETEVVLNTIPEFQLDIGAAAQSISKIRSSVLSLQLRKSAVLLTSRVEVQQGHIVSYEWSTREQLESAHGGRLAAGAAATLYTVLSQLRQQPGIYMLHHQQSVHGENAIMYTAKQESATTANPNTLSLAIEHTLSREKEAKHLQVPPVLSAALLPVHKLRRTLPLAFSAYLPPPHLRKKPTAQELKKEAILVAKRQKRQMRKTKRKTNKKQNNLKKSQRN